MIIFFFSPSLFPKQWKSVFMEKVNNKTADCKLVHGTHVGKRRSWWSLLFWGRIKDHPWEHCSFLKNSDGPTESISSLDVLPLCLGLTRPWSSGCRVLCGQSCDVSPGSGAVGERRKGSRRQSGCSLFSLVLLWQKMEEWDEDQRHMQDRGRQMWSDKDGRRIKGRNKKNKKRKMRESSLRPEPRGQLKEAQRCQRRETDTHIQRCRCAGKHIHTHVQQMYREKRVWAFLGDFNCDIQLEKRSRANSIFEPFKTYYAPRTSAEREDVWTLMEGLPTAWRCSSGSSGVSRASCPRSRILIHCPG